MSWDIIVSEHAKDQAEARFPGENIDIHAEVSRGLSEGRLSSRKPAGLHPPDDPLSLYVPTADGKRVYALRTNSHHFTVTTTLRPVLA